MEKLLEEYKQHADAIAEHLANSDALVAYLEVEEEAIYKVMVDQYEPEIDKLYRTVAESHPMQLLALEEHLLDPKFEGMYMPKLMAYSVLRGVEDEHCKYYHPQEQFGKVILAMVSSPNFEMIKNRVGQGIEVGFALSSDIWISNLINKVYSKVAKNYLQQLRKPAHRNQEKREKLLQRYRSQLSELNFYTATFPKNADELHYHYPQLREFLKERIKRELPEGNLQSYFAEFLSSNDLPGSWKYVYIFGLIINYYDLDEKGNELLSKRINKERVEIKDFNEKYFDFLLELLHSDIEVTPEQDGLVSEKLDKSIDDDLSLYYSLMDTVHEKGFANEETQEEIRTFYVNHAGLSTVNECVRASVLEYFKLNLKFLEPDEYSEYFELNDLFSIYINIFQNEKFNQSVKNLTLEYIRRCTKVYTNKRGKDYQSIKKFVVRVFLEHKFMTEKQLKAFFRTKRKKKAKKKPAKA